MCQKGGVPVDSMRSSQNAAALQQNSGQAVLGMKIVDRDSCSSLAKRGEYLEHIETE